MLKNKKFIKIIQILLIIAFLAIIYFFFKEHIDNFVKQISKFIKANFYSALIVLVIFSLLDTTVGIIGPSGAALFIAANYYPNSFLLLSLVSYIGVFLGTTIMYLIARYSSKMLKINTHTKLWCYFKKNAELSVMIFSATAASNVISVLSGVSKMNYWRFIFMTFIGRFVVTYILATNLLRLIPIFIKNPSINLGLIIMLLIVVLSTLFIIIYKWTRKVHKDENNC